MYVCTIYDDDENIQHRKLEVNELIIRSKNLLFIYLLFFRVIFPLICLFR